MTKSQHVIIDSDLDQAVVCQLLVHLRLYKTSSCASSIRVFVLRKQNFGYAKTKMQISFVVTAKLISAFVYTTYLVQFLHFLNTKFQVSSHLLWLYKPSLCQTWSENQKTGFLASQLIYYEKGVQPPWQLSFR